LFYETCKKAYKPSTIYLQSIGVSPDYFKEHHIFKAVGCEKCIGTGYSGRAAILELLVMTDTLRQLVLKRADAGMIAKAAIAEGMGTMFDDGLRKAMAGETSLDEVLRVTQDSRQ